MGYVEPASVFETSTLRLQITAEPHPCAIGRILEGFASLGFLPNRVLAARSPGGTLRIEVDTVGMPSSTLELIVSKLADTPCVLNVHWFPVEIFRKGKGVARFGRSLLSERERQIVRELSLGNSDKVIARRLALSPPTVNFHLRNVYRKLRVGNRSAAVAEAVRRGWLD
jgi:DNA-binding CsgD family transcriptional regulator